jgi:hypothetical protein
MKQQAGFSKKLTGGSSMNSSIPMLEVFFDYI